MAFKKLPPMPSADSFIAGAGKPVHARVPMAVLPWDGLRSDKNTELYNLRMTERQKAMLQFISDSTPDSMQAFCMRAIEAATVAKIKELTGQDLGF